MRRPNAVPDGPRTTQGIAPARRELIAAETRNRAAGHENAGALSSSHGFLPVRTPALSLPPAVAELDEVALELPSHFAGLTLRRRLEKLGPVDVDAIPDALLQRAATVLGIFAQSYWHCDLRAPAKIPENLDRAWTRVCQRLGREVAHFTYNDGIITNFRLPGIDGPYDPRDRLAADMRLLVPTIDNAEERIFYLTQVAVLLDAASVVETAARLQEGVLADDRYVVKALLAYVRDVVQYVTDVTFMVIDPNPASATHVDPTMWTRTVANTFLPFRPGPPGPSGTASPLIHVLDVVFGRKAYAATKISHETLDMRRDFPEQWRRFLGGLAETSLVEWARRQDDPELDGLLVQALLSFAGDSGFLGRHRLKVYGFLDTAFKLGRDNTIGGFSQLLVDRTWDVVHDALAKMRDERVTHIADRPLSHVARVSAAHATVDAEDREVMRVRLDVTGTGLRYRPGDRLAVLPSNDLRLIGRTLGALGMMGDEEVVLNREWKTALRDRPAYRRGGIPDVLPLRELLAWARLRPANATQAAFVLELAPSSSIRAMVENHLEDEVELWDLLMLARQTSPGFDEALQAAYSAGALLRLLPPEGFRLYSIASAPDTTDGPATSVDLVLTRWLYTTRDAVTPTTAALAHTIRPTHRQGTASSFLLREAQGHESRARALFKQLDVNGDGTLSREELEARLQQEGLPHERIASIFMNGDIDVDEFTQTIARRLLDTESPNAASVVVQVISPPRFSLPNSPNVPVVMFAAGTGIAPFRAFWQERAATQGAMTLLYFATRTEREIYLRGELEDLERKGKLRTRVALTRGEGPARFDEARGTFAVTPGRAERLESILDEEREAALLYRLLLSREHGGLGGHFYICGRSGFAKTVLASLERIIARFHTGIAGSHEPGAPEVLRKLVADNRLCMDIFTTHRGVMELPRTFRPSELVMHNAPDQGYWIVLNGRVLDMTEFRLLHPGGPTIIDNYAGIDASKAYAAVQHHVNPEVHAMAGMYEIGRLERIALPGNPVGKLPNGTSVDLETTMRMWLKALYAVTECENLIFNEYTAQDRTIRGGTAPDAPSSMRTMLGIAAQERMEVRYVPSLFRERLDAVWRATIAHAPAPMEAMHEAFARAESTPAAAQRRSLAARMYTTLDAEAHDPELPGHAAVRRAIKDLRMQNQALLVSLKLAFRSGVQRFERMDRASLTTTASALARILEGIPSLLTEHTNATLAIASRHGLFSPS